MNKLFKISLLFIILISSTYGASISVPPFSFDFYITQDHLDIKAKMDLYCRREKWVIDNSAEWEIFHKAHSLDVDIQNFGNRRRVTLTSPKMQYLEVTGTFKPSKECRGEVLLSFTDKIYAIGSSDFYNKPIALKYLNHQPYRPGNTTLNLSGILNDIDDRNIEFRFQILENVIHVYLSNEEKWFDHTSVNKDPATNMPYRIRRKPSVFPEGF